MKRLTIIGYRKGRHPVRREVDADPDAVAAEIAAQVATGYPDRIALVGEGGAEVQAWP